MTGVQTCALPISAINFNVYSVDSTDRFVFSDDLGTIKGKESHKWDKTKDLYGFGYRFRYVLGTKTVVYDANTPKTIYSPISLGATQLGFIIKCDGIPDGVCPNYNFNTNIAQDNYALEFGDLGGIKLKENFYFAFRSCQALKSLYNLNFANVNTTSAGVSNLANITYQIGRAHV